MPTVPDLSRLTRVSEIAGRKSSRQCEAFGGTVEAFCGDNR